MFKHSLRQRQLNDANMEDVPYKLVVGNIWFIKFSLLSTLITVLLQLYPKSLTSASFHLSPIRVNTKEMYTVKNQMLLWQSIAFVLRRTLKRICHPEES